MCEFISWIEDGKEIYFLTCNDLNTKEGRELVKELKESKSFYDDISGHGAIRKYFNLKSNQGTNKECSDFSNPNNFPPQIIKQIKNGNMQIISQGSDTFDNVAFLLLTDQALVEYKKIKDPALVEYNKIKDPALVEYNKIKDPALVEYKKIKAQALAEYKKITDPALVECNKIKEQALAEYNKITYPAWDEYNKITDQALAECNKIKEQAWAEYKKSIDKNFWKIFSKKSNRKECWR